MKKPIALLALLPVLLAGCISLPVGIGVEVSSNGCAGSVCWHGDAGPHNFYDTASRLVVLWPDQPAQVIVHELCHAHQHQMVLEKDPASNDLMDYFKTSEGAAFLAIRDQASSTDALEDAAWVCAWYYVDPSKLTPMALAWAEEWLR